MGKGTDAAMIAIDFFCGGGGLTKGLTNAGITVLGGYDNCQDYKDTYEKNNGCDFICKDIRDIDANQVYSDFPIIKGNEDNLLLSGCAPCQPFSSQRRSTQEHTDTNLLTEFGRIVERINPAYILVENVPGLKGRGESIFKSFITKLSENGYLYAYRIVNAKDYGVPQNRNRLVIMASRLFQPIIPDGLHGRDKLPCKTLRDTISHYPPIEAGSSDDDTPNHSASSLSPVNMERIKATPRSGGDRRSWPTRLVLDCHNNGHNGHTDVYGRMDWDKVAPALTARCYSLSNGRYGHPEQNRAISLREAATIQSFPDDYIFYGTTISIGRQIGNAVPVKLAEELARYILHMSKNAQLETD
jgi:DNA (cytosine-5)-methyltransferase 1